MRVLFRIAVVCFVGAYTNAATAGLEVMPHVLATQPSSAGPNCTEAATYPDFGVGLGFSTSRLALGVRFARVLGETDCGRIRQGLAGLYGSFVFPIAARHGVGFAADAIFYAGGEFTPSAGGEVDLYGNGGFGGELFYLYEFGSSGRATHEGEEVPKSKYSIVLRVGYRTFESGGTSFDGPYVGVALNVFLNTAL